MKCTNFGDDRIFPGVPFRIRLQMRYVGTYSSDGAAEVEDAVEGAMGVVARIDLDWVEVLLYEAFFKDPSFFFL